MLYMSTRLMLARLTEGAGIMTMQVDMYTRWLLIGMVVIVDYWWVMWMMGL